MAQLLQQRSGTAWAGRTREHQHGEFLNQLQSLLAQPGSNRLVSGKSATTPVLLTYY